VLSVAVFNETRLGRTMVTKKIEQGWVKAELQIKLEKPAEALEILREIDADAKQSKTWRLAAEAKTLQARQSNNDKRLFKEAVSHYENALKENPSDKTARRNLNSLRSEMDGLGIRAGGVNVFFDDGAPTFVGILSIIVALGMLLVSLKVIPDYFAGEEQQYDYEATLTISYTPSNTLNAITVDVVIGLDAEKAPIHVDNFVKLAERGEYNNVIFHRIIDNFMIQGGDFQNEDGTGGYAAEFYGYCDGNAQQNPCNYETQYTVPDEADNGLLHNSCTISMAKTSNPNTGGSQFFLIPEDSEPSHLDGVHTVFGEITSGCNHVTAISEVPTGAQDKPVNDVTLLSVDIIRTVAEETV
jgi:cyclophilin family peptidyl-prolyl cis-trans isomerase